MKIIFEPILHDCREIYEVPAVMDRYWAYVDLMTKKRGERLPLGDFSPMGTRQAKFLDDLISMRAEDLAAEVCLKVSEELDSEAIFRVMLVVVDEPKNGWTQRYLTDADWRFSKNIEKIKKSYNAPNFDRWVTVNLWTTDDQLTSLTPNRQVLEQTIRSALFRAYWQKSYGYPSTLEEMLRQEGSAFKFYGERIGNGEVDLDQIEKILQPLLGSRDYPVNFAALYGDKAAISVGYHPLGLPEKAGFIFAAQRY